MQKLKLRCGGATEGAAASPKKVSFNEIAIEYSGKCMQMAAQYVQLRDVEVESEMMPMEVDDFPREPDLHGRYNFRSF